MNTRARLRPESPKIHEEDWDNLILLDGCRYDLFADRNTVQGELRHRFTNGSATPEFLRQNFAEHQCYDTVYVTANPMHVTEDLGNVFYETIDVWETDWDEEFGTVQPADVRHTAEKAHEEYPDKRLLVHFMQPHYPFIGEKGQNLKEHAGTEYTYREATGKEARRDAPTVWELLWNRELDREAVWEAYGENLALALSHVDPLVESLDGKTVITSDHGNLVGDRLYPIPQRAYGHPAKLHATALTKVPWLIIEADDRRAIHAEGPERSGEKKVSQEVTDRLEQLGYR